MARIVPLAKKSLNLENISAYRPIAVTPIFSKVFELVLRNQIVDHMESNNLFNKNQFGFRKTQSATSAILEMVSKILQSLENGDITMTIMIDLTKAFDCVPADVNVPF